MAVSQQVAVAHHLRIWHALHVEVQTPMRHSRGSVMLLAAGMCGSHRRTKIGVLIDYTVWLAGWGITPAESAINRFILKMTPAQAKELKNKLARAEELKEARRAVYLAEKASPG